MVAKSRTTTHSKASLVGRVIATLVPRKATLPVKVEVVISKVLLQTVMMIRDLDIAEE